ncbi:hypothetical protein Ahy_B08g090321 [Arachis hypogaea]|uniref:C2H2-type domain-containing protein n=1 Tax=Arachis hypogaea TaxID=3818 RepID=A0A444Y008_ARAHY|nr:hypothetical protein Ahy_B08g090321 [Arachis hypogaea]
MSGINQLDMNQKLKEKRTRGYNNDDDVNSNFIHHASSSSSKGPIRNNINQQHHHHDDPDNNNQKKVIDDVVVNDGENGRIQSLPYKKNRPYTCSKCMVVFETSQKFTAHISSHYKLKSKVERMKRQMAKMMRRSKKTAILEHQQQHIKNFRGGEGSDHRADGAAD